jgi:glycine betaine/proline transport system substrate-binding protein
MKRVHVALWLSSALVLANGSSAWSANLVIAAPNWPSGKATANILKIGLSKEFGLDADIKELGALNAFVGLDSGTVDIHPEVWSPNLDAVIDKYVVQKKAVILAHRAVNAWQGLCATPAAAKDFKSVDDLKDKAKTAVLDTDGDGKGELWIGAPTWLSTGIERVRANSYGYVADLSLVEAEEDVAMAAVDAAVATDQPMVFACYAPHYVFDLHKITRLAEPAHADDKWKIVPASDPDWIGKSSAPVAWPTAHFSIAYATALTTSHADVAKFLENVDFTTDEVTEMSYALEVERQDPVAFAKAWVDKNSGRVDGWARK